MSHLSAARFFLVACVITWAAVTIREPLWIDELHTLWTISGSWENVFQRSIEGNQTPFYFLCLKVYVDQVHYWCSLFGNPIQTLSPLPLRSFSIIGMTFLVSLLLKQTVVTKSSGKELDRHSTNRIVLVACVGTLWLMADRIGMFYAIEARPYVWVALSSCVLLTRTAPLRALDLIWVAACCFAFYLHYTAIFVVVSSWIIRTAIRQRRQVAIKEWVGESLLLGFLLLPGLVHLNLIRANSSQWNSFAGACDLLTVLRVLPWFAWGLIPLAFLLIRNAASWRLAASGNTKDQEVAKTDCYSLLPIASSLVILSLGGCWALCFMNWIPLIHSRYLIGVYSAILLVGMGALSRLAKPYWIVSIGLLAIASNGWLQGSWPLWQRGEWIAWQRNEDWDAVRFLIEQKSASNDLLFFAPFLVETQEQRTMDGVSTARKEYFTFAVHSLKLSSFSHQESDHNRISLLANNTSGWRDTIEKDLAGGVDSDRNVWLLARTGHPIEMESISSSLRDASVIYRAGNLQLWQIRLRP